MVVVVGGIAVLVAVLLGFSMAGGHVGSLIHLSEFVTIGGASMGALVIMSPKKVLMDLVRALLRVVKGSPYNRKAYVEVMALLYAVARLVRREGGLALEPIISSPDANPFFQKYPLIDRDHHAKQFICTGLSMIGDRKLDANQLSAVFEEEIKVVEREHHATIGVLSKTADALPGFGIVAAVLGIVVTMQAIDGPASEIGHKVGALVGTFLGILMSYGFFGPLASRMEFLGEEESIFYRTIAAAIVAIHAGDNPKDVIVRVRRLVGTECRPTQGELADIVKNGGAA